MSAAKTLSSCSPGTIKTTNNPQCPTCVKLMKQRDDSQRRFDQLWWRFRKIFASLVAVQRLER